MLPLSLQACCPKRRLSEMQRPKVMLAAKAAERAPEAGLDRALVGAEQVVVVQAAALVAMGVQAVKLRPRPRP